MNVYNVVDSLQHSRPGPPPFTQFEYMMMRKYTYDVNPIKAYHEYMDVQIIAMCNSTKCRQIEEQVGEGIC